MDGELLHHLVSGLWTCPRRGLLFNADGSTAGFAAKRDPYIRFVERLGNGVCKTWYAHRVIWEASKGAIPPGLQVDHLNGDPTDNRLENLDLVTPEENRARLRARYRLAHGADTWNAKLSPEAVAQIRSTAGTISALTWAKRLGLSPATIRQARNGRTWVHVSQPPAPRQSCRNHEAA